MTTDRHPPICADCDGEVSDRELRSQIHAFLADRTIQPVGYEWEHDRLRVLIDSLMELPAMRDRFGAIPCPNCNPAAEGASA